MTFSQSELAVQNLLSALTDSIHNGEPTYSHLYAQYGIQQPEYSAYERIIQRLSTTLVPVKPQRRYVGRLKRDLMGMEMNVITRIRFLPARVQIAAIIAVIAGALILLRKPINLVGRTQELLSNNVSLN